MPNASVRQSHRKPDSLTDVSLAIGRNVIILFDMHGVSLACVTEVSPIDNTLIVLIIDH